MLAWDKIDVQNRILFGLSYFTVSFSLGAVFYRGSKFQFCYLPLLEKVWYRNVIGIDPGNQKMHVVVMDERAGPLWWRHKHTALLYEKSSNFDCYFIDKNNFDCLIC